MFACFVVVRDKETISSYPINLAFNGEIMGSDLENYIDNVEDMKDLKQVVRQLASIAIKLDVIIRGEDESDTPSGLIYIVDKNSRFRKIVVAWLWLLTGAVTTIGLQVFYKLLSAF